MITPMTVWICMAALVSAIIIARFAVAVSRLSGKRHRPHLIELGNEREEFWIPGDPDPYKEDLEDGEY